MTEWRNDGMTEWQNDGMTDWQTGQKQYSPDLRSRGHKNIVQWKKNLWFYTENYGTSIYEGEEHNWLPKTVQLWFIIEKQLKFLTKCLFYELWKNYSTLEK